MNRPRHRRKDPQRTGPIRNAGEAWEGEPRRDSARRREDAASSGVREGYRVIDEQIRRGRRIAQERNDESWRDEHYDRERRRRHRYSEEPRSGHGEEPWSRHEGGGLGPLGMPLRHMERLAREILFQIVSVRPNPWRVVELLLRLQVEAVSEIARLGFGTLGMVAPRWGDSFDEDVDRIDRDIDERYEEIQEELDDEESEPWLWPLAPSTPTTIRSTVPIPVLVSSHERTEIDLELPAGSQSLDLEIEPPMAVGAGEVPLPAFEAEIVVLADGPPILRIEVPRDLPAGRYLRRVLIAATGEAVGELTVQVGTIPKPGPKPAPKTRARPRTRKP